MGYSGPAEGYVFIGNVRTSFLHPTVDGANDGNDQKGLATFPSFLAEQIASTRGP